MTTRARAVHPALTAARGRRMARHLAGVRFCDGCAQVCDSSCRTTAHQRRVRTTFPVAR